jgi:hypothetical protein
VTISVALTVGGPTFGFFDEGFPTSTPQLINATGMSIEIVVFMDMLVSCFVRCDVILFVSCLEGIAED